MQKKKRGPGRPPHGKRAKTQAEKNAALRAKDLAAGKVDFKAMIDRETRDEISRVARLHGVTVGAVLDAEFGLTKKEAAVIKVRFGGSINRGSRSHPDVEAAIFIESLVDLGCSRIEVAPVGGLRETNTRGRARAKELEKKLLSLNQREAVAVIDLFREDEIAAAKAAHAYAWARRQEIEVVEIMRHRKVAADRLRDVAKSEM